MTRNGFILRTGILFIIGLVLSVVLIDEFGSVIEKFETRVYQKISVKKPQFFMYDSLGVPLIVYQGKLGKQYNTVTVAEQAINWADCSDSITGIRFNNCINWLIKNNTELNDSSIIYLDRYDWPSYKMVSPWRSGMNQGRAIQAFIKAYKRSSDTIFLKYAWKAMNTLFTEVKDGGVTYIDSSGYWYEEYADDNVGQSRVLNGMIVVLEAVSEYYKTTDDPRALFLFDKGVLSVKNNLYHYDNNGHSNYDILGKPASTWYHKFHITQLEFLYNETRNPVFKEYYQKWKEYKEPTYLLKLYRKPNNIGVSTVFTIISAVFAFLFIVSYFILIKKK